MSKLIGEPVKVLQSKDSIPGTFIWRKRLYRVNEILGWWHEPDEWWNGKAMRFFVRVDATHFSAGTYELYKLGKAWFLHRILD